jgi:N-acetylglucosaminylphosphatidylinositol deacetylase
MIRPKVVITFDSKGVSGHLNHISTFSAIQYLVRNGHDQSWTAYQLLTVNSFKKYAWVVDIYLTWLFRQEHKKTVKVVLSWQQYWTAIEAMKQHRSQFVWFRRLYVMFSRYIAINTLQQIM